RPGLLAPSPPCPRGQGIRVQSQFKQGRARTGDCQVAEACAGGHGSRQAEAHREKVNPAPAAGPRTSETPIMMSAAALTAFLALNGTVPQQDQPPPPAPGRFSYGSTHTAPDLPSYAGVGAINNYPGARAGYQPPVINNGYYAPGPYAYGYGWDPVG